jgi:hypothetical protein
MHNGRDRSINEYGAVGGMRIGREHRSTQRKPAPVPLCPPQIPQIESGPQMWQADYFAWVMARPPGLYHLPRVWNKVIRDCKWGSAVRSPLELWNVIADYYIIKEKRSHFTIVLYYFCHHFKLFEALQFVSGPLVNGQIICFLFIVWILFNAAVKSTNC